MILYFYINILHLDYILTGKYSYNWTECMLYITVSTIVHAQNVSLLHVVVNITMNIHQ